MKEFCRSLKVFFLFSVLTGILYPLIITILGQTFFPKQANGSLIQRNGQVIGSELIGQLFIKPQYFHGRPSAANYDATNSTGCNFGPTNAKFLEQVKKNIEMQRGLNNLSKDQPVPADLVLASGSGLDPHISLEAALIQIPRVAKARGLTEEQVREMVNLHTESPWLGIWGGAKVNVLKLNLDLDGAR